MDKFRYEWKYLDGVTIISYGFDWDEAYNIAAKSVANADNEDSVDLYLTRVEQVLN